MSIEILGRAVTHLENLKDEAVQLPWSSSDQSPSMDGRNWVIRTEGVPGIKMSGHDYGHFGNVELIVALSRTVDPLLDLLRVAVDSYWVPGEAPEDWESFADSRQLVALARAVLGEVHGE